MGSLDTFQTHRARLLSLAYRMLGSSADAEDVLQEAWLRWRDAEEASVRDARGWLLVATSRLCLDKLKAARRLREHYAGTWLPEPVRTETPLEREAISLAFLVLLETLTPVERAVFLMHQVFEYTHPEIGRALDMTDAAVRQAFHRAREHVAAHRPRFAPSPEDHARLLRAFGDALMRGDPAAMVALLAEDATVWTDGGGKVRGAAAHAVHGRDAIVRFLGALTRKVPLPPDQSFTVEPVNGWPALVGRAGGAVSSVTTIETDGTRIVAIRNVVNPDKLRLATVS